MRSRERLARFFYGRYGPDKLNTVLLAICMVILFFAMFFPGIPGWIMRGVSAVIMVLCIFRMLSKNIERRRRENEIFTNILLSVKSFFIRQYNRIKYVKKYRYRKCPGCKSHLRFPYKKGKHEVKCPRCGNNFSIRLL